MSDSVGPNHVWFGTAFYQSAKVNLQCMLSGRGGEGLGVCGKVHNAQHRKSKGEETKETT